MEYIYCIINNLNNKKYVGKTTSSIKERFQQHLQDAKRSKKKNRSLYSAIGVENFTLKELEYVEDNTLLVEKEIYWIQKMNSYGSTRYKRRRWNFII